MKRTTAVLLVLTIGLLVGCREQQMTEQKGRDPMVLLEAERTIVRRFVEEDWPAVHKLAVDWRKAPGPEFDKWPTSDDAAKGMAGHFAGNDSFQALCLRDGEKVIGLLALNGLDGEGRFDLGHVILSEYQDNDIDREALSAMVEFIFRNKDVETIVTNNASTHVEQVAPLKTLGFRSVNKDDPGIMVITKAEWEQRSGE